ncbi:MULTISPECIES: FAD-binding and (Fe-S)-binding domain-containing protein [unclassified Caballeronia]|uniref:FAD-binding and (Fe-S)-binding domain-containing protein n=1 Tax=unclassified Caballeronia TaxID=2646786 RepID=UPI002858442D|nr:MULTISPECIES: FAD-binding and (Fe-S)-binding domain-containing protein [unclassified Caballeronia]MDR5774316.1 FAD-binding and (Fe-S)-binding domain-containing protein [Caballeronia sp. LZ002]MDR5849751.1 FAD-binding and (Fe-S)-binding domain-containing protein [Caballeronia sp. LZ003]
MLNTPTDRLVKPIHLMPASARAGRAAAPTPLQMRLQRELKGDVLFDRASRGRYATDASIYQIMPQGVVVPRDQEDLRLALEIAREAKASVLARGAGTSQCGQTIGEALVIDTSKWLNNIVHFDKDARTVTVEPGVVLDHLNAWLKPHGLWFPVDVSTSAQCTIGGMAGNNSCGSRSMAYGIMVHNVLAIDAILADGYEGSFGKLSAMKLDARMRELVESVRDVALRERDEMRERIPKVLRRVAGYNLDLFDCQSPLPFSEDGEPNLANLLVGSEGTLAFSRQLTLKLAPLPEHKTLGVVNFPSFYDAMEMTQHIVKLGPVAVELVDRTMIDLAMSNQAFRPVIEKALVGEPEAVLLVEFAGADRAEQVTKLASLVDLMSDLGLPDSVVQMPDAGPQKALWEVRKAGLNIMMSMKGDGKPVSFIEDCAVPLEHLAQYTSRLTDVFRKHGTEGTWYAHASVGTLHVRPILDMRRDGGSKMRAIAEEAAAMVREYKGAFSGEHGDGLCRGEWVAWQYGPRTNEAFREIKQLFDPDNRLSPDRIVAPPKMDDTVNFRFPPSYRERAFEPQLDWSAWNVTRDPLTGLEGAPGSGNDLSNGLAKAVEMCNNNGHCRKFDAGTMCPSYRITKDEQHVTRGRANTLRLALSGQLGEEGLASQDVKDVLDLCVSCKGCKRDCPTGVDMARIKIETRAARTARHGVSVRERLVAYLPRYAPYASRWPFMSGAIEARMPVLARWLKTKLGLAPQRAFPRFEKAFLSDASTTIVANATKEVLLFVDTFNNYMEPANARAAQRVLEAAGYTVHLNTKAGERPLCCGRTFLSAGLVDEAKTEARRTLDTLLPYVERGVAIVGLEPSCLLSLRDEFLGYGYGDAARKLAEASFLFEEFLVRERVAGRLDIDLKPLDHSRALLHGHCHQKAFDAVRPVETVLKWIPGLEVKTIESSCCGMAGSFGYEAEHYEASQAMAELSLPAVRKARDARDAVIVADGTSCRHQIADGAQTEALHVARVLANALA